MGSKSAIIAGSQGFRIVSKISSNAEVIEPFETPFGMSPRIYRMQVSDSEIYLISRHGDTGYTISAPFVNYRANIWALKEMGVERIVAWSGPGAIDSSIPIGDILIPGDILDETKNRDYTFYNGLGIGFIRQNPVFCPDLKSRLAQIIESRYGHCRTDDVYVCTQGPRLETPAEIKKFAMFGGTLVGMTLVPEAFLAKELEMCYCPICYVTNYAEGIVERKYQPGVLFEGLLSDEEKQRVDAAVDALPDIAVEVLISLDQKRSNCNCGLSMERYRRRGDIGEDWHKWIKSS